MIIPIIIVGVLVFSTGIMLGVLAVDLSIQNEYRNKLTESEKRADHFEKLYNSYVKMLDESQDLNKKLIKEIK